MDLRCFLDRLREAGEPIDIREPVRLEYKVGAICRQLSDANGLAGVVHKVGRAKVPLVVKVYGAQRRVPLALGAAHLGNMD